MSKAINDTDRYTVTTSAIQDLVGKVKAEDAKKVDIQNVSLESQTTTILAQVQAMAASNIHYRRFYTTSDGGSANISDKPTSSNAGFMCEAYCNRRVSASDWRYVVICYVKTSTPNIAWVTQATTAISWSTIDTHWTSHLYAGSGTAANAATTNGNTKLTAVDNSTVRNTVTIQGSNNVSVSSDANGVITIDGSHNHDAVYMKATAGTKNLASNTETTIGTVNGSDVKLKMPVIPGASSTTPIVDGTASKGSESSWARGDHVHPTDTSREAASNKKTTLNSTSNTDFPTSKAVATFVNSSIATATANFLGTYDVVADLGLTTSATNAQIATALGSHTWPSGVTPTNNDYVFVSVDDPGTTTASAEYRRFKYDGSAWSYEYTLNNSSFTQAQWDAINSGVTASFVTNAVTGVKGSSESSYRTGQVNITKSNIGLGSVVNTGDSATPVSGGTTKFTTGGAYTELGKKVSKSGDTMTGQLLNTAGVANSIQVSHGTANTNASISMVRTDTGTQMYVGVGSGGTNHGVYSNTNSNWMIRADGSGNVIINDGKASNKVAIGNSNLGSTTKPIYLASGVPTEGSSYAGGTAVTLNGTSAAASTASFYAPTGAGTSNYVLKSNGSGAPTWVEKAPKAVVTDYPAGFTSSSTSAVNWGTLKDTTAYDAVTKWNVDSSEIAFAKDKSTPSGHPNKTLSVQVDGYFYQNEGNYRVLDTSDVSVPTTVPTLAWNTESTLATIDGKNIKVKLPASPDTDVKVTQTVDTSNDAAYPLLAKNTTATATITDTSRFTSGVTLNPKNKSITATTFIGSLTGNASSATILNATATNEINFGKLTTTTVWFNYRKQGDDASSSNITDYYFGNRAGDVTGVTLHAAAFTGISYYSANTKVTTANTTKTYLAGATATSYTSGAQTSLLADTGVYLTTTAGELNATQYKVNEHCTMKYNSTKSSLDFTFA